MQVTEKPTHEIPNVASEQEELAASVPAPERPTEILAGSVEDEKPMTQPQVEK